MVSKLLNGTYRVKNLYYKRGKKIVPQTGKKIVPQNNKKKLYFWLINDNQDPVTFYDKKEKLKKRGVLVGTKFKVEKGIITIIVRSNLF